MRKIYYLIFIISILGILSSCNFMDYNNETDMTDDYVKSRVDYAGSLATAVYGCIPSGYSALGGGMYADATDDAENSNDLNNVQKFNNSTWNQYSNPDDKWGSYYSYIQKAYLYFEKNKDLQQLNYDEYRWSNPTDYFVNKWNIYFYDAEVSFLRALCYFELMKRYGEIPIINKYNEVNDEITAERQPISKVIETISKDLRFAASKLFENWNVMIDYDGNITNATSGGVIDLKGRTGRPTKGACYALLSKAFLYAGSPLFNNGQYNTEYCDSAAYYAAKVLDMNIYQLETNYQDLYKTGRYYSKELIFERRNSSSNSFEKANYPISIDRGVGSSSSGCTCPSQNLADEFEMIDGSKFDWNNPEHSSNPFKNRDPRFNATFVCNGETFASHVVESWDDGADGRNVQYGTKTGYYLKKYIDPNLNLREDVKSQHLWYLMRLADLKLIFAEAANEVVGPSNTLYGYKAIEQLNDVRNRVKMPKRTAADKDEFRTLLRHERRVELAFEDSRYWDVRRWNIGGEAFSKDLMGLEVIPKESGGFTYRPRVVESRTFENYMNLYPIPQSEIIITGFKQNPGW